MKSTDRYRLTTLIFDVKRGAIKALQHESDLSWNKNQIDLSDSTILPRVMKIDKKRSFISRWSIPPTTVLTQPMIISVNIEQPSLT